MKIKTVNITDQVVEYLKENIESGKWNIGEKIPSENQMVMELGVSRSSIRSALQYLIGIGVLKSYQGKGTFLINTQVENWDEAEYKITSKMYGYLQSTGIQKDSGAGGMRTRNGKLR